MSRIDVELGRIRKILQQNYKDVPGWAEREELNIKNDVKRGEAWVLFANLFTPEEGHEVDEKTAAENRSKERIFFQVKTLPLPQNRTVKVIFQSVEDRENSELLHLLHQKTKK